MPWMELKLKPQTEWDNSLIEDWANVFSAYLEDTIMPSKPGISSLPGHQTLCFNGSSGNSKAKKIVLSESERLITLTGFTLKDLQEKEFAHLALKFGHQLGAMALRTSISAKEEEVFWRAFNAEVQQDPLPLAEEIKCQNVGVKKLYKYSLLVTYEKKPALCLEPIFCNTHAAGPISLAQRRLEKLFGGQPLGFASMVSAYCPWQITNSHWQDLLAYSRLKAFDLMARLIILT